ncbi:MAG: Ig-like domain repeat protein [Methanobrevibacter sp.]|uniref:Ig-like domain repeat protein n=1 Tax=Methanobrevibacter sp. TaxID=66852 RepID=UPI002E78867C|nr:Ig-like domain repeat protein [Methanobrevibacter sp.]MEE0943548.1 Ig-like domain repeat protein [Methanobrevibacter sp.]
MKIKYLLGLILIISVILSFNVVFASEDLSNGSYAADNLNQQNIGSNDLDFVEDLSVAPDKITSSGSNGSTTIYVGQSITDDGGNGTDINPYSSLEKACQNINGENEVIINVFNGTYVIGSELKFKTNNLCINGIGDVVFKNGFDSGRHKQAIELSSNVANFTMNNIVFDMSGFTSQISSRLFFTPFRGMANYGTYSNCTFIGSSSETIDRTELYGARNFNAKYIGCIFKDIFNRNLFADSLEGNTFFYMENCQFIDLNLYQFTNVVITNKNVTLNGIWFGQNNVPDYMAYDVYSVLTPQNNYPDYKYQIPLKYAIFNVTEKYLGNNLFEIIGQLTWNGTNDSVGNSFNPMTVLLSSETGDIVSEAILENGTFKTIYTSNSTDNKVTAKLDDEVITLDFKSVDVIIDAPAINVGDNQNINLTFAQPINNTITITVNNKTYEVKVDSDSINFTVSEALKEGTYIIDVVTSDEINHIYGSNSTELVVSKVSDYTFTPIVPSDAKVDDTVTINVELPSDATGTVIVSVGDNNFSADASANVEINITGLVAGDNNIIVTYSGDDKYVNKSSESILTAEKVELDITNETLNVETPEGTVNPEFSIALPNDATGNLTVIVNNKTYTQELVNGSAKITVDDLTPGDYNATVTYTGDDKYDAITTTTNLTVPKVDVPINNNTFVTDTPKGTTTPEFSINLPNDATGNLTVIINGKNYTQELVNGSAKVTIPNLTPGDYNATVTYSGDDKYDSIVSNTTVSVPKPVLTAKNISMLYTSGTKYTVQVKVDGKAVTGKTVNFVINGKKTTAKTNKNGYASVKITLPPKSKAYKVTANYLGVKVTNKVTVKSILVAKNLKAKKSAKTLKIKVTLKKVNKKYLKGKKVTLKFKGKTYKVKTNKKGVATFTIKKNVLNKLKVGKKYTYKVTYGKDSVNKKITIKK